MKTVKNVQMLRRDRPARVYVLSGAVWLVDDRASHLSCLLNDLIIFVFEMRLPALELRGSFFEKSFHAFIAVFTGKGLRQEFTLESQSVGQR
jgi:hypothetical protein